MVKYHPRVFPVPFCNCRNNGDPFPFESKSPVKGVTNMVDGAEVWSSGTWKDDFGLNFELVNAHQNQPIRLQLRNCIGSSSLETHTM